MPLDLLPARCEPAATNMAADLLLLQHYPAETHARLRPYGWTRAACTFGYSQPIAWVREQLAADPPDELCRRPTGGGVVDHRNDWTYALVLPRGHALYDARAVTSYEAVHRALAAALRSLGCDAALKETCDATADCEPRKPGLCFTQPELFDVIDASTGTKIAGAAQKRTKRGLLLQGSVWRPAAGAIDGDQLTSLFAETLAHTLATAVNPTPWPDPWSEAVDALAESYGTPEWNERR